VKHPDAYKLFMKFIDKNAGKKVDVLLVNNEKLTGKLIGIDQNCNIILHTQKGITVIRNSAHQTIGIH